MHTNIITTQVEGLLSSPPISANAISNFATMLNAATGGVDVGFSLVDSTGVKSIMLRRNYLNDVNTATVLQTWDALTSTYTWSDTSSALQATGAAYYWLTLIPTGTTGKPVTIGPKEYFSYNPRMRVSPVSWLTASHAAAVNGTVLVTANVGYGDVPGNSYRIFVTGYEGNATPVSVAQQSSRWVQFKLNATGETVTLSAAGVNPDGSSASPPWTTTTLTLNAPATVPARPMDVTVAQIPAGMQINFSANRDDVTSYQIWRFVNGQPISSATLLATIAATDASTIQYLDTTGYSGNYAYFVIAVNAAGPSIASDPGVVNFVSATSILYVDGQAVQALQPAAPDADVTAQQPIAYTGFGSNLVPNGTFLLDNIDGWVTIEGSGVTYDAVNHNIHLPAGAGVCSPTFNVTPGQKYRVTFSAWAGAGPQVTYLRIYEAATYSAYIQTATFTDFIAAGSIAPAAPPGIDYTYEWTCPAGIHFCSLSMISNGGVADLAFSKISAQDYVAANEWGADKTGNNTANNTANVGSLGVSGGLYGSNGNAIDGSGNIVLKNIGTVQGTTGTLTSTFADLPSLGGMSYSLKGNPALVSLSLAFQATSSGGVVTSTGFSPTTATTSTGTNPPTVSIVITGDGSGATATVTWVGSGGPTVTFTPTVNLNGGAGYSYANAIVTVTVPSGTSYSGPGSGTYTCAVSTPVPQSGVSISVQALIDGLILFDPSQWITDANGRAKFNQLQVFSIAAGSHTFQVQGKYDGATAAKFIGGMFNVVELG